MVFCKVCAVYPLVEALLETEVAVTLTLYDPVARDEGICNVVPLILQPEVLCAEPLFVIAVIAYVTVPPDAHVAEEDPIDTACCDVEYVVDTDVEGDQLTVFRQRAYKVIFEDIS